MNKNPVPKKLLKNRRNRLKISRNFGKPRLCVFRSSKHIFAQVINDKEGKTLISAYDTEIKGNLNKSARAFEVGKILAKKAKNKKILEVVFDRGTNHFWGRVKSLAEGAREGGLKF